MAELKVKFTGDNKALKRAAQEAAQIMGAAAAEGAAATRKADADVLASKRQTLQEQQRAAKAALDQARADMKGANEEELARLKTASANYRAEMKVRAADLRAILAEQRAAAKEAAALEKAAADARRADRQREQAEQRAWIAEQRQAAKDLDREAKKLRDGARTVAQGGARPDAPAAGGLTPAGAIGSLLTVEVIKKLISTLDRVGDIVRQANEKALGEQERAAAILSRREEAFRLAGATPAQARALAAQATASGIESGALDEALGAFGANATRVDPEALARIFRTADQRSIGGALALSGRGVSASAAVDIAGRFYSATRGQQITPEIAGSINRVYAGQELTADEILTNALASAGVANPAEAARLARPITGTPDILANRQRNEAEAILQAALGDDAQGYGTQERVQAERLRAIRLSQEGRSVQQAIEGLTPSFLAPVVRSIGDTVSGADYERGREAGPIRVVVDNMPRSPAEAAPGR